MAAPPYPVPRVAALCLLAVVAWIYLQGVSSFPLKWEEPRRALVAQEMIHRGDYVVPRLLGAPYLNKPPLQNWLIALLAGNEARRVGPTAVRGVTLLALAATCVLLWRLGVDLRPALLPALVFLSTGLTVQYLRTGELDGLFTFLVTAALCAFEQGRRRGSPAVQWGLSQLLVGLGVLAKGLAPLFFYPPVLLFAWRRRSRGERVPPGAFLAGLALMLAVVAAWAWPYSRRAPAAALGAQLADEVAQRTLAPGVEGALGHIATYPFVMLAAAAPWSLLALCLLSASGRAALRAALSDPWVELCAIAGAWGLFAFVFVPGVLPRYLLPVLPAVCVVIAAALERGGAGPPVLGKAWPWGLLAAGFSAFVLGPARDELRLLAAAERAPLLAQTWALGLVAVAFGFVLAREGRALSAWPLCLGLLYGLGYAGVREARVAQANRSYVRAAEALAAAALEKRPVVVAPATDRKLTYPLATLLDRPLREDPPARPYYYVSPVSHPPPRTATLVHGAEGFALWRVVPAPPAP